MAAVWIVVVVFWEEIIWYLSVYSFLGFTMVALYIVGSLFFYVLFSCLIDIV